MQFATAFNIKLLALALLSLCCSACDASDGQSAGDAGSDGKTFRQWKLPGKLREISGLALTVDERLLSVTDEQAIVYELDFEQGGIVKAFALGDPVVRGDFEGIAVVGDKVWLMTSDGLLFVTAEGDDGEHMSFDRYDTGLGDYCELEGLATAIGGKSLLLACKETNKGKDPLMVFEWSVDGNQPLQIAETVVSEEDISDRIDKKHVRPSALGVHAETGNWLLLASNHKVLATLSPDGHVIDAIILPGKGRHHQAEGIEVTADGHLLIADEGGDGKARLAVYRWSRNGLEPE